MSVRDNDGNTLALKWAITQSPQDTERAEIAELYAAGKTIKEIAKEMNIPKSTVHRRLQELKRSGKLSPPANQP
ncbi:MAG: helix-turn-helix domain-containing protein [Candidatus Enterousia sp.]